MDDQYRKRLRIVNIVNVLSNIMGILGAYGTLIMVLIVTYDVLMRYFLNMPTIWAFEFSEYLLIVVFFCGSSYCLLHDRHVSVDLITSRLPIRVGKILEFIANIVGMTFCLILTWQSWIFFWPAYEGGWRSDTILSVPLVYPYFFMTSGLTILTLQYFVKTIHSATFIVNTDKLSEKKGA